MQSDHQPHVQQLQEDTRMIDQEHAGLRDSEINRRDDRSSDSRDHGRSRGQTRERSDSARFLSYEFILGHLKYVSIRGTKGGTEEMIDEKM